MYLIAVPLIVWVVAMILFPFLRRSEANQRTRQPEQNRTSHTLHLQHLKSNADALYERYTRETDANRKKELRREYDLAISQYNAYLSACKR